MERIEIFAAFLASPAIPEEIKNKPGFQLLQQFPPESSPYPWLHDFMLGAEAMYKFLSNTFGDDLK